MLRSLFVRSLYSFQTNETPSHEVSSVCLGPAVINLPAYNHHSSSYSQFRSMLSNYPSEFVPLSQTHRLGLHASMLRWLLQSNNVKQKILTKNCLWTRKDLMMTTSVPSVFYLYSPIHRHLHYICIYHPNLNPIILHILVCCKIPSAVWTWNFYPHVSSYSFEDSVRRYFFSIKP